MGSYQYVCTRLELEEKLDDSVGRTLGEVDTAGVFDITKDKPKVTGIAGDVVEQSIIGFPANSSQEPDLVVDGVEIELKTTGIRKSKKGGGYEAKEPMSITAVSLDRISSEEFETSSFWHKVENMLIVYYLYDSEKTVMAADYAEFPIVAFQFHEFTDEERETLEADWQLVHDFVKRIQDECPDEESRKERYPLLSSALRRDLMLIDTAPKYPHPPRFRLKRSTVTAMAKKRMGERLENLPKRYTTYAAIDSELHGISSRYRGMTLGEIAGELGIAFDPSKSNKNLAERLVVRAFGGEGKMGSIELFSKIGLKPKTVALTKSGSRTEDMKLFTIDFDEFGEGAGFEESLFCEYFSNSQLLCIVLEEPSPGAPLTDNVFLGFKRIAFDDGFIESEVRRVWKRIGELIESGELVDVVSYDRNGKPSVNKTGVVRSAPNFPKSRDGIVFVRGTSSDSTYKPEEVNDVQMYKQQIWVKGSYIAERLSGEKWV